MPCQTLSRLHSQTWRLHLQKDIILLENVQRGATRKIEDFRSMPYNQRLKELNLTTRETRPFREDLLKVFCKVLKDFGRVENRDYFTISTGNLRGHIYAWSINYPR